MISSPCYFKVFNIKCGLDKPLCLRILVYFTGIKVYPSGLADVARINPLFYWTYLDQLGMVRYGFQVFSIRSQYLVLLLVPARPGFQALRVGTKM